ncbi:MAG: FKBP-type peptidyl-prolyl cis-trans isomerase [Muribaculaceae bacterium]|nr:FKBP-type peptidyl-prolyl cis-trans isomerase [Muribaculaceae bacterium]
MKILKTMAIAMLACGAVSLSACSGSNGKNSADTADSIAAIIDEAPALPTAPADSLAAIFANPEKKSETATDSTYAVTASGLKYMVLREGTGASPKAEDNVTVMYAGQLTDGQVFDSSYDRGEPATFPLNRVIPGWTEGLQLMKEGGKTVFYIPSDMAYGKAGAPPMIGPDSDLIFTVELIKVN